MPRRRPPIILDKSEMPGLFDLRISAGITGPFVHSKHAAARVVCSTEKAIQVELSGEIEGRYRVSGSVWLPRVALQRERRPDGSELYALARWFRPDGYQARVFDRIDGSVLSL